MLNKKSKNLLGSMQTESAGQPPKYEGLFSKKKKKKKLTADTKLKEITKANQKKNAQLGSFGASYGMSQKKKLKSVY